ncbi:MAG: flagellar filament capping protein FliD [Rubrivivax sp.]|nr:flagellar filament capping protein FliD [Rubrivivax sp.]
MTTTSSGLSSPGVGSGLDVNSIVKQLVTLERRPITSLQTNANRLQTQISGLGQLQSLTSAVRDTAGVLADADTFTAISAISSDAASLGAVTTSGGTPVAGTYSISTTSLAATQTTASAAADYLSAASLAGEGTLTLNLGRWNADMSQFTPKAGSPAVDIVVSATDTLANVRDKINALNAGVNAAIISDTTGVRLTLRSTATGADNGFRLTANDVDTQHVDGSGLSRLAFDPAAGTTRTTRTMAAADAVMSINGVEVRSATDTFEGAIEGLTLTARKAPASNVTLTVGANTDAVKQQISRFVAAYNALAKFLASQTRYDPATQQAGLFQGDSSVLGLANQMRTMVGSSSHAAPTMTNLSSLGVELQKDGTLQINSARLDSALKNLPELASALSREVSGQPMLTGSMVKFKAWADGMLDSGGTLPGKTKALQSRLDSNQKQQERLEDRVAAIEKRLRAQYTSLDTTMSRANALSSYVSQQITAFQNFNKASAG